MRLDTQSPRTLEAATGMTVVVVEDADAHQSEGVAPGAESSKRPLTRGTGSASTAPETSRVSCGSSSPRWTNHSALVACGAQQETGDHG